VDKDSSTFGVPPKKLAELWNIDGDMKGRALEEEQMRAKSDQLHDMLAGKLPLDLAVAQSLPKVLAQLCEDIRPFTGDSVGLLICDPDTDISIIKKIKNYYKDLSKHIQSEDEHDVIAVIYYATIASALVHHRVRITSFSNEHLHKAFSKYSGFLWLTSELKSLFSCAIDCCASKGMKTKKECHE